MIRYFRISFVFVLFISDLKASNFDLLKCDQYTINEGLPQSFIEGFFQDSKGYLWISTQDGISRFNGYEFENFYSNPFDSTTILSNYILGMDNWNQDSICFTTRIGVSIYDPVSEKFRNFPFALNNDTIGSITSSLIFNNDSMVVSTSKGLFGIKITRKGSKTRNLNFNNGVKKIISFNQRTLFISDSILYLSLIHI